MHLNGVAEEANEEHLEQWHKILEEEKISATNISPYLHKEMLYEKTPAIDGTAIENTGFEYMYPRIEEAELRKQLQNLVDNRFFPNVMT